MGRKASTKNRKQNETRKTAWAKQLFSFLQQEGISKITMIELAQYLGKSKSTVYEYFKSKDEILTAVLFVKLGEIADYREILSNDQLDYIGRYRRFMDFMASNVADISIRFLRDLRNDYPLHWAMVDQFLAEMLAELHCYYEGGVDRNEFKSIPIALLLAQDQHFIFEILTNPEFLEKQQLSIEGLVNAYLRLKLEGLKK